MRFDLVCQNSESLKLGPLSQDCTLHLQFLAHTLRIPALLG